MKTGLGGGGVGGRGGQQGSNNQNFGFKFPSIDTILANVLLGLPHGEWRTVCRHRRDFPRLGNRRLHVVCRHVVKGETRRWVRWQKKKKGKEKKDGGFSDAGSLHVFTEPQGHKRGGKTIVNNKTQTNKQANSCNSLIPSESGIFRDQLETIKYLPASA